jgi:uncharacterized protein
LFAASYRVPKGHRLEVDVSSSNFDRYDRNLNTGEPFAVSPRMEPAEQTIHHSGSGPSRVLLPVRRA